MIEKYSSYPQNLVDTFLKENNIVEKQFQENPYFKLYLYKKDGNIVGYLLYSEIYERVEIEQIRVKEEYQGQKIASFMMEELLKEEKEKGKENITLEVKEDNTKAISLYEKYGFKKKAIRKGYYQGIDGILMEKEL